MTESTQQVFLLENLGCAHCAANMEAKINALPRVHSASLTYTTKQLRVISDPSSDLLAQIREICTSIEPGVRVTPRQANQPTSQDAAPTTKKLSENASNGISIGIGAVLFILGKILEHRAPIISILVFVLAYLVLGARIVITAVKNLLKGRIFDENFLMSIATLGAFVIGNYPEAVGVMLFYRVGELFEDIAVEKSRSQIMDAVDMRPEVVSLINGDTITVIPACDAVVDDILLVRPGDRIPLDGVIIEGQSRIDTSPVTGEPVPIRVGIQDAVTSGCVNESGLLKIRVVHILEESMVTRILNSVENAAASKPTMDRFITRFARIYTPFVVLMAIATAVIPSLFTGNWSHWIYTALTFLVISCPCALVLSVPLAFFSGIGAGSKKGILFKGGVALEALHNVKTIVMDKTGTITKGNFVVQNSVPIETITPDELLTLAASCELSSTHPIGNSIVTAAKKKGLTLTPASAVTEFSGKGILATLVQGEVLCGNKKLMDTFHIDFTAYQPHTYGTEVLLALDGQFIGHIVIADTIKPEAIHAITAIHKYGITTAMLTGDAQENAQAVATETGIDEVHAKLLPEDKVSALAKIRAVHGAVMFVGDGINDAPVLAGADVGAAMGSGADAAIEAADLVFMTSSMEAIPQSLAIAHTTNRIAKQNVVFALVIKVFIMALGLAGFANMWMAVFADTGVAMICILNSIRVLYKK